MGEFPYFKFSFILFYLIIELFFIVVCNNIEEFIIATLFATVFFLLGNSMIGGY